MTGNIIQILESDIAAGWNFVKTEASDLYEKVKALIGPPLQNLVGEVESTIWGAASAIITNFQTGNWGALTLENLETSLLNTLSAIGGEVLAAAQALTSQVLQNILLALHVGTPNQARA